MKTVSEFEAQLLRILHGFFGRLPADQLLGLVEAEAPGPACLSRNAVELVIDTMQKGVIYELARGGGWKRERFLIEDKIAEGRLWSRRNPEELGFRFSEESLKFLIWITANHPNRPQTRWSPEESRLTVGDRLLFYLAFESLRGADVISGLMKLPPFANHALIWLTSLGDLVEAEIPPPKNWDFSIWLSGQGAFVLECLQARLAERWFQLEQRKLCISQPEAMRTLGRVQHRLLTALFDAAEKADRRDLCRFFLIAMNRHLEIAEAPAYNLDLNNLRLADRMEVWDSASVGFRQLDRLARWTREAVSTGFYDEGYTAAQLWKSDWEDLEGDKVCQEAGHRLQALEPIGPGSPNRTNQSENLSAT